MLDCSFPRTLFAARGQPSSGEKCPKEGTSIKKLCKKTQAGLRRFKSLAIGRKALHSTVKVLNIETERYEILNEQSDQVLQYLPLHLQP